MQEVLSYSGIKFGKVEDLNFYKWLINKGFKIHWFELIVFLMCFLNLEFEPAQVLVFKRKKSLKKLFILYGGQCCA